MKDILSTGGSGGAGANNKKGNRDQEQNDTDIDIHDFCGHGFLLGYWCFEFIMVKNGLKTGIKFVSNQAKMADSSKSRVNIT